MFPTNIVTMRKIVTLLLVSSAFLSIVLAGAIVDSIRLETLEPTTWQESKAFSGKIVLARRPALLVDAKTSSLAWLPTRRDFKTTFHSRDAQREEASIVARRLAQHGRFHIGCCEPLSLKMNDFWIELNAAPKQGKFVSTMIARSSLEEDHLLRRLFPSNPNFVPSRDATDTAVWIGSKDSQYPLQFSVADQFIAQAYGSSEIYLIGPEHTALMKPFAKSHPRYREARFNIFGSMDETSPTDTSRPKMEVFAIRVVLKPGDVLFVPARWFMHVKAIDDLSIWYSSQYEFRGAAKYASAYEEGLPREPWWEDAELLVAFKIYIRMVIDRYNLLHDPSLSSATGKVRFNLVDRFVEDVIFPRFDAPSENDISADLTCPDDPQLRIHEAIESSSGESDMVEESFWAQQNDYQKICGTDRTEDFVTIEGRAEAFEQSSRSVALHFFSPKASTKLDAIYLADFIEDLVSQTMGSKHVETFIRKCLMVATPSHRS